MVRQRTIQAARSQIAAVTTLAVLSASCGAGWHRPEQLEPGPLSPRQQVQVFAHQGLLRWHAVRIGADSISGIPYLRPVTCDSCRVALPRSSVDSLRLGDPVGGFWQTVGIVVAIPLAILIWTCGVSGSCFAKD